MCLWHVMCHISCSFYISNETNIRWRVCNTVTRDQMSAILLVQIPKCLRFGITEQNNQRTLVHRLRVSVLCECVGLVMTVLHYNLIIPSLAVWYQEFNDVVLNWVYFLELLGIQAHQRKYIIYEGTCWASYFSSQWHKWAQGICSLCCYWK